MISKAKTVDEYLSELSDERRGEIEAVRKTILSNLPDGYEEGILYGMIGYYVPHSRYPAGYHCDPKQPLTYVALAAQKNYLAVYLTGIYVDENGESWFRDAWAKTGKKLDMGKSCVRFKKLEDAALEVIGEAVARFPLDAYVARYEANLAQAKSRRKTSASG